MQTKQIFNWEKMIESLSNVKKEGKKNRKEVIAKADKGKT